MKKRSPINKNGEVRELTEADFCFMRRASEVEPELAALSLRRSRARKGEAVKEPVSIRLSPHVISFFKSKGPGWQTRIDRALSAFVEAAK